MNNRSGILAVVDGIAGSGKSTILRAALDWTRERGRKVFVLSDWKENVPPTLADVGDAEVLFTFEPTRQWVGSAIRQELSRKDEPYDGLEIAHAFALDRQIMYRRLILPALADGRTVIQDRSVTSSLVYQPIQDPRLTAEMVATLPGNALALSRAPNHLILTRLDVDVALERINKRADESKGVYGQRELLQKVDEGFRSEAFQQRMRQRGTAIHTLDTSLPLETTLANAKSLFEKILS